MGAGQGARGRILAALGDIGEYSAAADPSQHERGDHGPHWGSVISAWYVPSFVSSWSVNTYVIIRISQRPRTEMAHSKPLRIQTVFSCLGPDRGGAGSE